VSPVNAALCSKEEGSFPEKTEQKVILLTQKHFKDYQKLTKVINDSARINFTRLAFI